MQQLKNRKNRSSECTTGWKVAMKAVFLFTYGPTAVGVSCWLIRQCHRGVPWWLISTDDGLLIPPFLIIDRKEYDFFKVSFAGAAFGTLSTMFQILLIWWDYAFTSLAFICLVTEVRGRIGQIRAELEQSRRINMEQLSCELTELQDDVESINNLFGPVILPNLLFSAIYLSVRVTSAFSEQNVNAFTAIYSVTRLLGNFIRTFYPWFLAAYIDEEVCPKFLYIMHSIQRSYSSNN
jgi:hypothetical protein